jgi:DNA replication protein DnaC
LLCDACSAAEEARLDAADRRRREQRARIELRRRIAVSGMPRELERVELDRLDTGRCGRAIDCARGWAARDVRGLLLTGPFGTGKTTIAAGAMRLVLAERDARWVSIPELFRRLASKLGSEEHEWALKLLTARHALVLDDLDKARPTDYGAEQVFLAIDNAVTRGQQLLVTTNLSLGQLAMKWPAPSGEAIASRLAGYCTAIEVAGRDRRIGGLGR